MERKTYSEEFWRERWLAYKNGGRISDTVYVCSPAMWNSIQTQTKSLLRKILCASSPCTLSILDAGCGYGALAECMSKLTNEQCSITYTGVDFSPELIEEAKSLFPEYTFHTASLQNLPFDDNSFDWVIARSVKGMMIRDSGQDYWENIHRELLRVSDKLLFIEYVQRIGGTISYEVEKRE